MSEFASMIGQHYTYAYGRTGVLQLLLLSQADVDRLLGAQDRTDVERILTELKLTSLIDQGINESTEILLALEAWVRREVEEMVPTEKRPTFQALWITGDAPLLSFLLKDHLGLTSVLSSKPKSGMTAYDPAALEELVYQGVAGKLPSHLVDFVQDLRARDDLSPEEVDEHVAQYVTQTQLRLARSSRSKHIVQYITHLIDLSNVRSALRSEKEPVLDGGSIPTKELAGDQRALRAAVAKTDLQYYLGDVLAEETIEPIAFERAAADLLAADIAAMWNVPLSIEPVFAFAALTLSHLNLIRSILIGKSNELSPQEIKKILPPFIPATHYVL